jgi:hypothetical protein
MVRKCQVMTFAMATIIVAGGALAADKAVQQASAAISQGVAQATAMPSLSLRSINTVTGSLNVSNQAAATCSCPGWDNGSFANDSTSDGVASHLGGAYGSGAQAADDFYLVEGSFYKLNSISATLVTNSNPGVTTKAKCDIYTDCNGCPNGSPIYTLTDFTKVDDGTPYMMNPAYRLVTYTFPISANNLNALNRSIFLKGGVYWVSVYGLTDGLNCTMKMPDASFWGSTGPGVKGSVPKKRIGTGPDACTNGNQYTFINGCGSGGWAPVDDCCFGCKDLNFVVCATPCPILVDNGSAAGLYGGTAAGSPSQFASTNLLANSRTADDFVVPPCTSINICYIEGCVFTNCDPTIFTGRFEIYGNNCRWPSYTFGGSTLCSGTATVVVDLGYALQANGKSYEAYKLEFHNPSCTLTGGSQYWISIGVQYTFSLNERAFFCQNWDCRRPNCLVRWNPGAYLAPNAQIVPPATTPWVTTGVDYSFTIAGTLSTGTSGNSSAACPADFNQDGKVSVQDIFDFLSAWFTGCH